MRQHFVIAELIAFGDLGDTVQPHDIAECLGAPDHQALVRGVAVIECFFQPIGGAEPRMQVFMHPYRAVVLALQAHRFDPRSSSETFHLTVG